MSDLRALLNPPTTVFAGGPTQTLLNPIPGRLRLPEDTPDEEAEDDVLRDIDSPVETLACRAA